ncbi:alpha/beta fold hydrolase [Deinococcus sp. QL22]|uniref:alpha/beta fold hydrolase n=1 Tax=Deinococcus sp. QL22 TaxID=2939437 RepID=UPI0020183CCA|nr:alpha/beta fold hydrolase [Deinococcus sp. QL22]UQN08530.1 alpha/beta fold hydrolase [Deinococcus sp. QL22]
MSTFIFETQHALGGLVPLPVRLQVETYGTLNEARDNAVLVCHYFTGTMHAAGDRPTPGWWNALIGDGRAIDTRRFFVVCMNSLSNVQSLNPQVVTTGPDTLHDDGEPYGSRFPAWGLGELFEVQRELMRSLHLTRWYAVVGPSFGGSQALQWAARAPELAPRIGAVASSCDAGLGQREVFLPNLRAIAQGGRLEAALLLITFYGLGSDGFARWFEQEDVGAYLRSRSGTASLVHLLDLGRVVSSHDLSRVAPQEVLFERWRAHGTRLLSINIRGDLFFPASVMRAFAGDALRAGVDHTHVEIESELGHLACLQEPEKLAPHLKALLNT